MNYRQIYAKKAEREKIISRICPEITNDSGIYVFWRIDENDIKHCYCGQAKHLKERTASHLAEYDHIGLSLKKRGFYSSENIYGWKLIFKTCPIDQLDENEKITIKAFANRGFQLYNVTAGGQGQGKSKIADYKQPKTYSEGVQQGYKKASKEIANLFEKHLNYSKKSDRPNKNQDKAIEKFENFLALCKEESGE